MRDERWGGRGAFIRKTRRLNWRYEFPRSAAKTSSDGRSKVNGSGSA
jgi:hypothetical protein